MLMQRKFNQRMSTSLIENARFANKKKYLQKEHFQFKIRTVMLRVLHELVLIGRSKYTGQK